MIDTIGIDFFVEYGFLFTEVYIREETIEKLNNLTLIG